MLPAPKNFTRVRHDPLAGTAAIVRAVAQVAENLKKLSDAELRKSSLGLRYQILSGTPADQILPEAFAHVCESSRRTLNMVPYPVQILGGTVMHRRGIAVMQTGEGKTLTATLPLYLAALAGNGAHLATANDYLAQRDAEQMQPLFALLGLSTGIVVAETERARRMRAWAADITYTTAKEIGFDFLRDRLLLRQLELGQSGNSPGFDTNRTDDGDRRPVLRELSFVLVDEADSILIDEARTPLIVSGNNDGPSSTRLAMFRWAAEIARALRAETDFTLDPARRSVDLQPKGRESIRRAAKPEELVSIPYFSLYEQVTLAVTVDHFYFPDRHYVVRDGEIVIVDEFTGRLAEGRRWRSGIHQAIEMREGVQVTAETGESARITLQDLFLRYPHMCGMTGTVADSARELEQIYDVRVCEIPTNRPPRRVRWPDRVLASEDEKWQAIAVAVKKIHSTGQPVLVGTRSIDKSERLSGILTRHNIPHQVLNARSHQREAELVAAAGQRGAVTVATNMAGRGTDIRLDPAALELGGLHVICSELHDSARIDRQLTGRCGRQGDPGTWQVFLSLDDDILLHGLQEKGVQRFRAKARGCKHPDRLASQFRRAQQAVEQRHFQARKMLMYQEQQRHEMQLNLGMDPYLDAPQS